MPHNSGLLRGKLHHAGSPPLQQHPIVEMPPLQQPTGVEFLTQQPHVDAFPTQQGMALLSSSADDENNDAPPNMVDVYVSLPSIFNDKGLDDTALSCVAGILCCDPNSDTDEYSICMNCNGEAHTICTKQMNFQAPADDKLVITPNDLCSMGKERFKKTPLCNCQNVVFLPSVQSKDDPEEAPCYKKAYR